MNKQDKIKKVMREFKDVVIKKKINLINKIGQDRCTFSGLEVIRYIKTIYYHIYGLLKCGTNFWNLVMQKEKEQKQANIMYHNEHSQEHINLLM